MELIRVTGRDEHGDDQLAPDILRSPHPGAFSVTAMLHEIAVLDAKMFCEDRTHQRRIVPRELRDRVGQFLEPAVIDVTAVVHRITADEDDLGRIERRRRRRRPKGVGDAAGVVGIEGRRFVLERDMRSKTVPQEPRPRRLRNRPAARWREMFPAPAPVLRLSERPAAAFISSISDRPPKSGRIIG